MNMTMQVSDYFKWKNKDYKFIGADNIYQLFDPAKFGFAPKEVDTSCWKGFVIYFRVNNVDEIILDRLKIHDKNNNYPQLNGVNGTEDGFGYHVYENINLPLNNYSGKIIIGDRLQRRFIGRAFTGPHSYQKTYELEVMNGKIIDYKDTSGMYKGF